LDCFDLSRASYCAAGHVGLFVRCAAATHIYRLALHDALPILPVAAIAAAAWSWVEKMLHDAQRTSAPMSLRVSMRTAVWIVMCRSEEHTSELQSREKLVCRLLLEKKADILWDRGPAAVTVSVS